MEVSTPVASTSVSSKGVSVQVGLTYSGWILMVLFLAAFVTFLVLWLQAKKKLDECDKANGQN